MEKDTIVEKEIWLNVNGKISSSRSVLALSKLRAHICIRME